MQNKLNKSILIVEDELPLLAILVEKITAAGYKTVTAPNGKAGLSMALQEKPDLILLDLVMPEMDGMSMLTELRKDAWGKNVPVIILSNLSDAQQVSEATRRGVFDYLVKTDWKLDDVIAKIGDTLAK